jgi:hypothetical protein
MTLLLIICGFYGFNFTIKFISATIKYAQDPNYKNTEEYWRDLATCACALNAIIALIIYNLINSLIK